MKKLWLPLFLLMVMGFHESFAAVKTITGKVTDKADGKGLPGVRVSVPAGKTYTSTDKDGRYSISVATDTESLRFSFIGYKTLTLKIGKSFSLNVVLEQSQQSLNEIVVIGYGEQKKSKLVSSASAPMVLRGRVSGLMAQQDRDTESYAAIAENGFQNPTKKPLSTFSIDVDAASYSNVRRFINNGSLPPKDAVRIEEMINYFDYEYPQPKGNDPVNIVTEIADAPWNTNHKLVQIGLQGKQISTAKLPASNLVFLIDVSGSMNQPNKLPLLVASFKLLTDQLRSEDKVAIVVYAGSSGLVLPSTPGNEKTKIKEALHQLSAGGSTAGGAGIRLAYQVAADHFIKGGNNRVILATDGDFNVGASSDAAMESLIEEKRRSGVFLTVLGYGMGNIKDSKMETLADKGNGNYAYIDNISEARKVLVNEFGGTLFTIAKDVKLQLEFNPDKVQAYRLIGYENRLLQDRDFNDDKKDAGEMGSGHTVTALYEIIPAGIKSSFLDTVDKLKYQANKRPLKGNGSNEMLTVKLRYKTPEGNSSKLITQVVIDQSVPFSHTGNNFRFAAAVAEFGMLLRQSDFKQGASFEQLIGIAENAKGKDKEGYRSEFIKLAKSTRLMAGDLLSSAKK
ncbi:vWA domain-containing protein [Pedobacter heparinus]|uniref:vWA domain-containing protein n=1 Tax=Pedobacter heparinus TaxID=984 RepID=UPI00292D3D26|nr:von Willebrand factor type A domain-containing protein [Pedobacter heparinus]